MKIYLKVLLGLIVAYSSGCSSDDDIQPQTINMRINHYQGTGIAECPVLTFLVQEGKDIGTDHWGNFYSQVEGFDYEPGHIYKLSVTKQRIDNPPADGSSYKYKLKKIVSKDKIDGDAQFEIYLKLGGQSFITGNSSTEYKLLNQIEIDCNELCDELNENIQNQNSLIGRFKHLQNNEIQLVGFK